MFTLFFKDLGKNDSSVAGGKWASLGEMTRAGIPVPPGFVVLSGAFDRFIQESGLASQIESVLSAVDNKQTRSIEDASEKIRTLIRNAHFPINIATEIQEQFHALGATYVAVRSSATAEDGADHAWAGQLDSYLNTTEANLLEKIQSCWASLFTPRAIFYRFEKGLHTTHISVAVVVQKMVESEVSGIAFSVHPVTEDRNQIIIEAGYGLGEAIVSGQITPDSYVVGKNPRKILDANIAVQTRGIFRASAGGDEWRGIDAEKLSQQKLTGEQILELSRMILRIEEHYGFPCDIEWAYEGGEFFIVQSRPITTLTNNKALSSRTPNAKDYSLTYEWRWLKPLFYDFWCQWYLPDKSVVIYRDELCSQFYSRDFMVKMNETGKKFFLNKENVEGVIARFEKLVRECDLQAKVLSVGSVPVSEKETREAFDLLVGIQEEYAYFDFPYTDGAYALSEQNAELAATLQIVEQKKNAYRENFNEIFFEPTGLFSIVLRKLSELFSVSEEDLQWYLGDDIIALFRGKPLLAESLNERKLAYVFDKTSKDTGNAFLQGSQALSFIACFGDVVSAFETEDGIQGVTANKTGNNVQGRAYVLHSDYADLEKMRREMAEMPQGDILVMVSTAPEHMDAIRKASAIVTDVGGMLSHTAIVSREFGIPSIVGTGFASKAIKTGDLVEVDADNGMVRILERVGDVKGHEFLYFNLPMFPITNYFHGWVSPTLQYKEEYICGLWNIRYRFTENSEVIVPKDSLVQTGRKFIYLLEKNDKEFSELLFQKYSAIIKLADRLEEINFQEIFLNISPNKNEFYADYAELFPWVIGIGYVIDTAMEDYVRENSIDLHTIAISGESFITKEEQDLQYISQVKNIEERVEKLKKHAARYSFLLSNYKWYNPIDLSYFSERMENMKTKSFSNQTGEIKKPQTIEEWIGFSTYIRDERKRCNMLFNSIYSRYIRRECERYNVLYEQAVMLTPDEFETQKHTGVLDDYSSDRIVTTSHNGGFENITRFEWDKLLNRACSDNLSGIIASKGFVVGRAQIVLNTGDFHKIKEGDIIIASMTRPDFSPILKKASAIVTNEWGVTCHAAIISRELKIPCIIGTQNATRIIHDGDLVEVDANTGVVRILERSEAYEETSGKNTALDHDWILAVTRNMSFWHECLATSGFYHNAKDFGIGPWVQMLAVTEDGTRTSLFICQPNYNEYVSGIMQGISNIQKVDILKKRYQENAQSLLKSLDDANETLDNRTLTSFFDEYKKFCAGLMITTVIGRAGGDALIKELQSAGLSDQEIAETIGIITYPQEHTPLFDSQLRLMQIWNNIQQKKINQEGQDSLLEQWIREFGHIPINFCEDPWTLTDAEDQLQSLLLKDCERELQKAEKDHNDKQMEALESVRNHTDTVKILAYAVAEATYLNEFRKNIFSRVSLQYRPLFARIAGMTGSKNWRDCFYLTPDEMLEIVNGRKYDLQDIMADRKIAGSYMDDDEVFHFLSKEESLRFHQIILSTRNGGQQETQEDSDRVTGFSASKGKVQGVVKIVLGTGDFHKFHTDEILVSTMTSVDFVPIMEKAAAFVTNEGGITCHASIVAREMNKPCIIGTKFATQVLRDGDLVEVDADNGVVKILKRAP